MKVRRNAAWQATIILLAGVMAAVTACSPARYRRNADNEVYRIIQGAERQIFGQTNDFRIDTRYSSRAPAEIPATEIIDDRQQANRRLLTLADALHLGVTNSRTYQDRKELLYLTGLTLTGERYEFSPQFFSVNDVLADSVLEPPGSVSVSGNHALGFRQMLKTGGSISVSLVNSILYYYTGGGAGQRSSALSATLTQPLLRGFGPNNPAVESLTQAERNVLYAIRDFEFFRREFATEVVGEYFSLLRQKDAVRNRYTNYLGRVRSTQRLQERADREKVSDIGQTRQAELTAKNNYINEAARYQTLLDNFKVLLGLPIGERIRLDDSLLREMAAAGLVPVDLDSNEAFRLAVQHQLRILNRIDEFEDSKRKVLVAADRLRTDLNFLANASIDFPTTTDYTNFDPDSIRSGVGIGLDLPIDRLRERNVYRATLVSFESELRTLSLRLDELKRDIDGGLRTLNTRRESYEIQQSALVVANSRVEGALANIEAGRVEVRELVEAQDAQINAQNNVTTALVDYQQARLELMLILGLLETESEKFWLKDHVQGRLPPAPPLARQRPEGEELVPPDVLLEN